MSDTFKLLVDRFNGAMAIEVGQAGIVLGLTPQAAYNSTSQKRFPVKVIRQKGRRPFVLIADLANYLDAASLSRHVGRPTKREQLERQKVWVQS